jgi:hypothetical protein
MPKEQSLSGKPEPAFQHNFQRHHHEEDRAHEGVQPEKREVDPV